MIAASVALLLVSTALLAAGLASGSVPVLVATVGVALAALVPLAVAVVRTRPRVSAPTSGSEGSVGATDPTPGGEPPSS